MATKELRRTGKQPALATQVGGAHYKHLAIQPVEYCQRNRLPYCEASVVRYVTRHREKNGRQDLEKAIHCLQLLIEMEYPEKKARAKKNLSGMRTP